MRTRTKKRSIKKTSELIRDADINTALVGQFEFFSAVSVGLEGAPAKKLRWECREQYLRVKSFWDELHNQHSVTTPSTAAHNTKKPPIQALFMAFPQWVDYFLRDPSFTAICEQQKRWGAGHHLTKDFAIALYQFVWSKWYTKTLGTPSIHYRPFGSVPLLRDDYNILHDHVRKRPFSALPTAPYKNRSFRGLRFDAFDVVIFHGRTQLLVLLHGDFFSDAMSDPLIALRIKSKVRR